MKPVNLDIRPYEAGDAPALAALYLRSVRELGRRHYSSRQVEAWASRAPSPERLHALMAAGRIRLVAVDEQDRAVAFGDLEEDGHIHFLYGAPEVAGQGIASALYESLERVARERGLTRLYAEASEVARRFFLKKGFTVTSMRRFEIAGVPVHNYAVEKILREDERFE